MIVNRISDYFLGTFDASAGDNITHLKMQKLLYYAQGFHLAMHEGDPLFPNAIEAWKDGPVVSRIWHEYKSFGWQALPRPDEFEIYSYPPEVRELLDAVYRVYGGFSATKLSDMTHEEPPWKSTYDHQKGGIQSEVISASKLRSYFSSMVEAGRKNEAIPDRPVWPSNEFRYQRRRKIASRISSLGMDLPGVAKELTAESNPWKEED